MLVEVKKLLLIPRNAKLILLEGFFDMQYRYKVGICSSAQHSAGQIFQCVAFATGHHDISKAILQF